MADQSRVVEYEDSFDDSSQRYKWKWDWALFKVEEEYVGDFMRKIQAPGRAWCSRCPQTVVYGTRGRVALEDHLKTETHKRAVRALAHTSTLPGQSARRTQRYGLPRRAVPQESGPSTGTAPLAPLTPLADRTANVEAMLLSFAVENNLAFTTVPKLVELSTTLAADLPALRNTALSPSAASYKTRHGVADTFRGTLAEELKSTPFSLNLDEAMNSNQQKIVTILVSHFAGKEGLIVVNHLASFKLTQVTSENLCCRVLNT